jgi:sulfur-carrier protein
MAMKLLFTICNENVIRMIHSDEWAKGVRNLLSFFYAFMAHLSFTSHLQRHLECQPRDVAGGSIREVLNNLFSLQPNLRSYILDDQGALRKHVTIFIDNCMIADREQLTDAVHDASEVFVMQALSGG